MTTLAVESPDQQQRQNPASYALRNLAYLLTTFGVLNIALTSAFTVIAASEDRSVAKDMPIDSHYFLSVAPIMNTFAASVSLTITAAHAYYKTRNKQPGQRLEPIGGTLRYDFNFTKRKWTNPQWAIPSAYAAASLFLCQAAAQFGLYLAGTSYDAKRFNNYAVLAFGAAWALGLVAGALFTAPEKTEAERDADRVAAYLASLPGRDQDRLTAHSPPTIAGGVDNRLAGLFDPNGETAFADKHPDSRSTSPFEDLESSPTASPTKNPQRKQGFVLYSPPSSNDGVTGNPFPATLSISSSNSSS